jgi:predicted O-methyltransferase YrrM
MKKVHQSDRLFPNQEFNSNLYGRDMQHFSHDLYDAIVAHGGIKHPTEQYDLAQTDKFTVEQMASSPAILAMMGLMIRISGVKRVLEIGSFIGVSAMCFAEAVGPDGHVTCIEKFDHFAEIAGKNFKQNGFSERIDIIVGDALELLRDGKCQGPFDIAFIDGDKGKYDEYIKLIAPLISSSGFMIIDDIFFHGDVLNDPPITEKGLGVKRAFEMASALDGWVPTFIPVSNGVLVLERTKK